METAPGRKRHWLFAFDVTEGTRNSTRFKLCKATVPATDYLPWIVSIGCGTVAVRTVGRIEVD